MPSRAVPLTVAVIVVARNAEQHLPALLEAIEEQSYPKALVEVILVDSCSTDATSRLLASFSEHGWHGVRRLRNEERSLAAGWNLALQHSSSEAAVRLDAHAVPPPDFVARLVRHLEAGERIAGGRVRCARGISRSSRVIAALETSALGAAPAAFRRGGRPRYVDTLAYAAYRREVFDSVGMFNPSLLRNQDNEFHARCRKAGFRFLLDPEVTVVYRPRDTLRRYAVQKFSNGFWLSRALYHCSGSCGPRHLAPAALVVALAALLFAAWPAGVLLALIHASLVLFSIGLPEDRLAAAERLQAAALAVAVHLVYGAGTVAGVLSLPAYAARAARRRGGCREHLPVAKPF